jgi:hypothetical protein
MMEKLSARRLLKRLSSDTRNKIRLGLLSELEILDVLIEEAFDQNLYLLCNGDVEEKVLACFPLSWFTKLFAIKITALTFYAIPSSTRGCNELRIEFSKVFTWRVHEFMGTKVVKRSASTCATCFPWDEMAQAAFDQACNELRTKIVKQCYNNKLKVFRKACKAYQIHSNEFKTVIKELFENFLENHPFKKVHDKHDELAEIAHRIHQGEHEHTEKCWECNKFVECPLVCSRCLVAHYCGDTCQKIAWKAGHRAFCQSLKSIGEVHFQNNRIVKAAVADLIGHDHRYGYQPNYMFDCALL